MLDPAFKAKWLADLRSGVYPKTKGHLKDGVGFCCLGVALCTLGLPFSENSDITTGNFGVERVFYPMMLETPVSIEAGDEYANDEGATEMTTSRRVNDGNELSSAGLKLTGLSFVEAASLMTLNDDSETFEPVIGFIEREL